MSHTYDTVIWGPSLAGISKAIALKKQGLHVLLAGKFGFPGGKPCESLSVLFNEEDFQTDEVLQQILENVRSQRFGILYQSRSSILLHPEALKRACWQVLNENDVSLLFHVIPTRVSDHGDEKELALFGREGEISIYSQNIFDFSQGRNLNELNGIDGKRTLIINSFVSDRLPPSIPGFHIKQQIETPIGQYISFSVRHIQAADVDQVFNRELDRFSIEAWKKYKARVRMIPVYPEVLREL
jgi:hypothetical protein